MKGSLRAKARSAVAVALVALFVFVPSPARADVSGWWWLPPAWAALISGAAEVGINVLTGGEQPVTGGTSLFEVSGVPPVVGDYGARVYVPELIGLDSRGLPLIGWTGGDCVAGKNGTSTCGDLKPVAKTLSARYIRNGVENIFNMRATDGVHSVSSTYSPDGISKIWVSSSGGPWTAIYGFTWYASPELAVTTTELVCRPFDGGSDFVVSESSSPGAEIAPSPVCPPGSHPVRITVTNSVDGVLSDVSITAPDWYLADPSGVEFGFTVDGTICQAGNPECDALRDNPAFWDPATNGCYARQRNLDLLTSLNVSYPAAIPGPGDGWVRVPDEMCLDRPESSLPISEPPETPEDQDLGVISRAIERLIESVKAVGSSVRSVGSRIAEGIAGFRSDMNEKISGFRQDMKDGFDRVVEAIGGIGGGDGGDGDGDGGEGSLPGDTGDLLGRAGDALGAPFEDWTDALGGIPAAFSVPASDCMGPAWTIPGGGTHYPFQTCTGQAQRVARVVYVMTGAAVALVGLLAVVRLLGAAIGVQVNSGASQE